MVFLRKLNIQYSENSRFPICDSSVQDYYSAVWLVCQSNCMMQQRCIIFTLALLLVSTVVSIAVFTFVRFVCGKFRLGSQESEYFDS